MSGTPNIRTAPSDLPASLKSVVDYRKSGLSLNHVVGCPLDCGYCVRHLFNNFDMKKPHLIMDDEAAVAELTSHWAFRRDVTPIQLLNRATDPFLPGVRDCLFRTLELLDRMGLRNRVLVITRWHVTREDVLRMEALSNVALTVLVTWSGIDDDRLEPVDGSIAEASLAELSRTAVRTRSILYWRPIIAGVNDDEDRINRARQLADLADATVFTGLFHREEIRSYLKGAGVMDAYPEIARRKIMPRDVESRILSAFQGKPIFRKTSCGVAYAHRTPDFNGHYGIREICDVCPAEQVALCAGSHHTPSAEAVLELAKIAALDTGRIDIDGHRIEVEDSTEQQRYFIQHTLNYQVHDRRHPHLPNRHGRAEVGWS